MNFDYYSTIAERKYNTLEPDIEKLKKLAEEIKKVHGDTTKKEEKVREARDLRKQLLSPNPHLLYHVLTVKNKAHADTFRSVWQKENLQEDLEKLQIDEILYPSIDISLLPNLSFFIQFTFTLEKPYISCDEQEFYIIDNPIRKDRVFGLPYVAPSSWKGSFRSALWQLGHKAENYEIRQIFGNERATEEHERLKAGRLHLFPTFFTKKGLEIINPHDRVRRVGRNPILIESVPSGTSGIFTLLYVPFDLIGNEEEKIKEQVAKDIQLITEGLNAMFRDYGFGAKTSSGFGIAKPDISDGNLVLKAKGIEADKKEGEPKPQPPEETFKKYFNEDSGVKEKFKGAGKAGLLSNKQYNEKKGQLAGGSLGEFKKF
ncbi:MAG: RAMP superfamily CRISPR-associated protein, partial [candidate division WOR-3 bacterium]|nr:RAMP superfamily CRISPR-associated protein [candidate division WOR-3 bacterium]